MNIWSIFSLLVIACTHYEVLARPNGSKLMSIDLQKLVDEILADKFTKPTIKTTPTRITTTTSKTTEKLSPSSTSIITKEKSKVIIFVFGCDEKCKEKEQLRIELSKGTKHRLSKIFKKLLKA